MNKRATSWLLATLMALCAVPGVPTVRAQWSAESCPIVWIERARVEQRVSLERRERRGPSVGPRIAVPLRDEPRSGRSQFFSNSLYQRPPPLSLL